MDIEMATNVSLMNAFHSPQPRKMIMSHILLEYVFNECNGKIELRPMRIHNFDWANTVESGKDDWIT